MAGKAESTRIRQIINEVFTQADAPYDMHETRDKESLETIVRQIQQAQYTTIVAIGGDGTVSKVANQVVHTDARLGILPVGTANLIARELGIPLDVEKACRLLVKPHRIIYLDAMQAEEQVFISHISLGGYSRLVTRVNREQKRRLGRLIYAWAVFREILEHRTWNYTLQVDDRELQFRAALVMIANVGMLGMTDWRWGAHIRPDDGKIDLCIVHADTVSEQLIAAWHVLRGTGRSSPHITYLQAEEQIAVRTSAKLPVRADGELIGYANVHVQILPRAVKLICP